MLEDGRDEAIKPSVADDLRETRPPSAEELRLIRQELDPEGNYTK